jgi:hypothetical protein
MYYSFRDFKLIGFEKSRRQGKKYDAVLVNKYTGKEKRVSFGAKGMEQYEDLTPLGLYKNYNHYDKERRRLYKERHKKDIKKNYYSPGYFSWFFLW